MRNNIPEADELLDRYFPVLDGGFIALKDYMGSDEGIASAARNSYAKGTKKVSDDRGLIRRLMRDSHTSPIEFAEMQFHVRAPLYTVQQWLRHRTSNFCQESHRFSEVKNDYQMTLAEDWRKQSKTNKQGSSDFIDKETGQSFTNKEKKLHEHLRLVYDERISSGMAREQARKDIPVSTYSSLYIKSDLHNLLHFLKLRTALDAQLEIRMYADIMLAMVKKVFPICYEGFVDYSYAAVKFTRLDIDFLNYITLYYCSKGNEFETWKDRKLAYEQNGHAEHTLIGMGDKEYEEFWGKLEVKHRPSFELDITKSKSPKEITEFLKKQRGI